MKVAIIGTAPSSRGLAPYQDQNWKIWACSQGNMGQLPRVDVWFELHAIVDMIGVEHREWSLPYYAWLKQQSFPVYMQEKNDLVPGAVIFPWKGLIEKFGRNWFTSSVAWMMAFAISQMTEGDEIGLFGVDMAADQEHYTAQKAGCLRFMEIAKERGIEVTIPPESCLGQPTPLYGYSEASIFGRKLNVRLGEMKNLLGQFDQQITKLTNERNYTLGAIHATEYIRRTFADGVLDADIEDGKTVVIGERPATGGFKVPSAADFMTAESGLLLPPDALKNANRGKPNGKAEELQGG